MLPVFAEASAVARDGGAGLCVAKREQWAGK